MKVRHHLLLLGSAFTLGLGAMPLYKYLNPTTGTKPSAPTLVSAEEIVATVRSDAFLVSSRSEANGIVTVEPKVVASKNAPQDGMWAWIRTWFQTETTLDQLTVRIKGIVLAGFNLRNMTEQNVTTSDREVVINLGTPEFLGVLDDEMATETIKRETGWFRFKDDTLYLAAQSMGKSALQAEACRQGALKTAGESGTEVLKRITTLMRARDDRRTIRVIYIPGKCPSR